MCWNGVTTVWGHPSEPTTDPIGYIEAVQPGIRVVRGGSRAAVVTDAAIARRYLGLWLLRIPRRSQSGRTSLRFQELHLARPTPASATLPRDTDGVTGPSSTSLTNGNAVGEKLG